MSDPDYRSDRQGGEAPLRMDDHRQRRSRPRGPAPVTLIVSLMLLLGVGGGVLYMYRSGVKSGDAASRSLGKPLGDVRGPAPPAASIDAGSSGLSISRDDAGAGSSVPTLAPSPEEPLPPAAAAPAPTAATPAPVQGQPAPVAGSAVPAPASSNPVPVPSAPPPPNDPSTMPHRSVSKTVDHPRSIDQLLDSQASLEKARVDRAKAEKARADHLKAEGVPASESRPGPSAAGGSVLIQIGAFSTERLADQEWSRAAALAPGPMAGKGKRVVPVSKGGETLFRTSITGFASRDQALALCDRLQAAGGHCFVH